MVKKRCSFIIERGYSKGLQCGNKAILKLDKNNYCAVHYGKIIKKTIKKGGVK